MTRREGLRAHIRECVLAEHTSSLACRGLDRGGRVLGVLGVLAGYLGAVRDTRDAEGLAETLVGVSEALDAVLRAERAARRPPGAVEEDAETYRLALVHLAVIADELRPAIADRRGAYSAEGDPAAALLDAVDEATGRLL